MVGYAELRVNPGRLWVAIDPKAVGVALGQLDEPPPHWPLPQPVPQPPAGSTPGRPRGCPLGLPQIRTCPIKAYGSSSHGFATPLCYPPPLRGQGAEARCPRLVARQRSRDPAPPSRRRVLAGRVPRLPRYYEGLRLLPPRLPGLVCSPGDTPARLGFRSRPVQTPTRQARSFGFGTPRTEVVDEGGRQASPVAGEP